MSDECKQMYGKRHPTTYYFVCLSCCFPGCISFSFGEYCPPELQTVFGDLGVWQAHYAGFYELRESGTSLLPPTFPVFCSYGRSGSTIGCSADLKLLWWKTRNDCGRKLVGHNDIHHSAFVFKESFVILSA